MISPLLHDGDSLSTDAAAFARTLWKRIFFLICFWKNIIMILTDGFKKSYQWHLRHYFTTLVVLPIRTISYYTCRCLFISLRYIFTSKFYLYFYLPFRPGRCAPWHLLWQLRVRPVLWCEGRQPYQRRVLLHGGGGLGLRGSLWHLSFACRSWVRFSWLYI